MNNVDPKTRSPFFLFIFTNIVFLLVCAILWQLFWVFISREYGNWGWFSRSGSVLIMIGSILAFRSTLRLTSEERKKRRNMTIIQTFTPLEKMDQEKDSLAVIIGAALMISGTLIWAYADLLNYL